MNFFDEVAGGVDSAVRSVVAPVADAAGDAARTLRAELARTWHGVFGSPTPPGATNWNAYSHEELCAMVRDGASPGQVGEQSSVLDGLSRGVSECAEEVAGQQRAVAEFWRGQASGAFDGTLDEHGSGGAAVAEHTAALAAAVARASEALARAQQQMPDPVDVGAATRQGALVGGVAGGPAAALGVVAGAGTSWFGASLLAANRKAEAVEVMQRFEQALHAADPPSAPAKLPPGVPGVMAAQTPATHTIVVPGVRVRAVPHPRAGGATSGATRSAPAGPAGPVSAVPGAGGGAAGTDPSRAGVPGADRTSVPAQSTGSPSAATTVTSAAAAAAPVGGWATGQDGRASGPAAPWRALVGKGSRPGLLSDPDSRGGGQQTVAAGPLRSGRGAAGLPGVVAPGGGTRREEDREHRNTMPRYDKLFSLDEKPPPPVIGA